MPRGKPADHEQAHGLVEGELRRVFQLPEFACASSWALIPTPVGNVDQDAAGRQPAAGDDDGVFAANSDVAFSASSARKVHKIADGRCAYRDARLSRRRDALLVLDLRYPALSSSEPWLVPLAGQLMARQDQQVLGEVMDPRAVRRSSWPRRPGRVRPAQDRQGAGPGGRQGTPRGETGSRTSQRGSPGAASPAASRSATPCTWSKACATSAISPTAPGSTGSASSGTPWGRRHLTEPRRSAADGGRSSHGSPGRSGSSWRRPRRPG